MRLFVQVKDAKQEKEARQFLEHLIYLARLPITQSNIIVASTLTAAVKEVPSADLNMFPREGRKVQELWDLRDATGTTCIFCKDGGLESAIA